jgi:hypothetical protein
MAGFFSGKQISIRGIIEEDLEKIRLFMIVLFYLAITPLQVFGFFVTRSPFDYLLVVLTWSEPIAELIGALPHEFGHWIFVLPIWILSIVISLIVTFLRLFGINLGAASHGIFSLVTSVTSSPQYYFLAVLGGTIGYTIPPIVVAIYYFRREDLLACGAYVAYLAVSLHHMSWYVLQTNKTWDWYIMLNYLGALDQAANLSAIFLSMAYFAMAVSFLLLAAHLAKIAKNIAQLYRL